MSAFTCVLFALGILQELSMSDIEDISDPDFDDDNCMSGLNSEPVQKVEKSGGEKKPEAGNDSDWDSTVASNLSPRAKAPMVCKYCSPCNYCSHHIASWKIWKITVLFFRS